MGTTAEPAGRARRGAPVAPIIVFALSLLVFGGVLVLVEDPHEPACAWPEAFGPVIHQQVRGLPGWGEEDELLVSYGGMTQVRPVLRIPFRRQALRYELRSGFASYRASYLWTPTELTPVEHARLLGVRPPSNVPVGLTAEPWRSQYQQTRMLRPLPPEPANTPSAMRYAGGVFGGIVSDPFDGHAPGMREEAEQVIADAFAEHPDVLHTLTAGEVMRAERWSSRGVLLAAAILGSLFAAFGSTAWAVLRVVKP